jgi:hypothetical protein
MNDNAKAWVAALRSGEYEQTFGVLGNGSAHCCLGVACELAVKAGLITSELDETGGCMIYKGRSGSLPQEVRSMFGIKGEMGSYAGSTLARQNDSGKTFAEIADIIESEPEGLFVK